MLFRDIVMAAATQGGGAAAAISNALLLSGDAQSGTDTLLLSPVSGSDSLELSGS